MNVGDGTGQSAMLDLAPLRDALVLEPGVERMDVREAWQPLPQSAPRILDVLLDLTLLPPRSRVAELGLEQVVAGHRGEPRIDLPRLADTDPVDRRLHVVEYPAPRHAAQNAERLGNASNSISWVWSG